MTSNGTPSSAHERMLDAIVAAYIKACDSEGPQDRNEWLARFPEVASDLADFFADRDHVEGLVARPAELSCSIRPGHILARRYKVVEVREGGMAWVFIVEDLGAKGEHAPRRFALKTLPDFEQWQAKRWLNGRVTSAGCYTAVVERFREEASLWIEFGKHENILRAYDVLHIGGKPHLLLAYADSGDLTSWLNRGRLPLSLALSFALQVCRGMNYGDQVAGLVHHDLKPSNILIDANRTAKVADFGLARAFQNEPTDYFEYLPLLAEAFKWGQAGTKVYMAPEQFGRIPAGITPDKLQELLDADPRAVAPLAYTETTCDIFSFGVMMFEMVTGQRLFDEQRTSNVVASLNEVLPLAHEVDSSVPKSVSSLIARCLAFQPKKRYQLFYEVLTDLERILRVSPTPLRFRCPSCDAILRTEGPIQRENAVRCPKCNARFQPLAASRLVEKQSPRKLRRVPNLWKLGSGGDLLVHDRPDLNAIFSDPNPPPPYETSERTRGFWDEEDILAKHTMLAGAYAQHPDANVRKALAEFISQRDFFIRIANDCLVNMLADLEETVRRAAAAALWKREENTCCKQAVLMLRDEIRGHIREIGGGATTQGLFLGRDKAIEAIDYLVAKAPTARLRQGITSHVDELVVIEERITQRASPSVEYVDIQQNREFTYEVYRAESKADALAFLKGKTVTKELYYIEVETPEGNFGRDVNGVYEV